MNITQESDLSEVRTFDPRRELASLRAAVKDFLEVVDRVEDPWSHTNEYRDCTERLRLLVI